MKHIRTRQLLVSTIACAAAVAQGQNATTPGAESVQPVELVPVKTRSLNRVNVSYRMGLNIKADFKNLGGLAAASNPDLHTDANYGGNTVRTYDQGGYVGVDSTGNNHLPDYPDTTWYYGYNNSAANQGSALVLSSSSSPASAASEDNSDDPQHGFEISYDRELFQKGSWRFGVEGAFGYTWISIRDSRPLTATVNRVTDTFTVPEGVTLPPPGYTGGYDVPGALINSNPQRQTTVITSSENTILGERKLEADVYGFRLGPYAEVPLSDRFSLLFSGGLYVAVCDTRFSFQETVTVADAGSEFHSGSSSDTDVLVGGYVGGNLEYALREDLGLFAGVQFQSAGRSINWANNKQSVLNLSQSVIVSIGASYSF